MAFSRPTAGHAAAGQHVAGPAPAKHQIAGLYDLGETLGEGHYAVVKLASHVFTGEKVAVKVIDKLKLDSATRVQMLQEVQLMKLVQHPHVVRLYEVIDTHTKLYLVLEFADGGDMYDYIMRHEGGLEEDAARKYFKQVVTAIQYCHRLHVVHRDLKPENVVFFEKLGIVKLTDFGFSNQFNPGQRLQTSCGSLAYSAPEILLGDAYDAPAVDIWSLGVILYMLVCGTAPFQEANDSETLTMIMDCKYTFPKHISAGCKRLISRMLQRQPENRASLQDIVNDPWLGGGADSEGNAIPVEDQLPLVTREHLSEEDHHLIIKKMVAGNIAGQEDIIGALDLNEYNHITATYFLLAERKLKSQRAELARRLRLRQHAPAHKQPAGGVAGVHHQTQSPNSPTLDLSSRRTVTPSATVDSLLSPSTERPQQKQISMVSQVIAPPPASQAPATGARGGFNRLRNISMVAEEEEDEEDEDEDEADSPVESRPQVPGRARLSRHSSTSSLATSPTATAAIVDFASFVVAEMRATSAAAATSDSEGSLPERPPSAVPAPFPVSSQIGTGGLVRQGSLRRPSEGLVSMHAAHQSTTAAPSAPTTTSSTPPAQPTSLPSQSEHRPKSASTPSTPPSTSSQQSSPARFKVHSSNKKLVATRSSPQLILKQIHEEAEEGTQARAAAALPPARVPSCPVGPAAETEAEVDPVDSFPSSAAGMAVIRRLEQRRRMHKARTQSSCSSASSDASDDDAESRGSNEKKSRTPPLPSARPCKRDSQHDDSSDSQEPGMGASGTAFRGTSSISTTTATVPSGGGNGSESTTDGNNGGSGADGTKRSASAGLGTRRHRALHGHQSRRAPRIRQSHSLNRISELHVVADFFSDNCSADADLDDISNNNSSCPSSSVASVSNGVNGAKHMLPPLVGTSESDSEKSAHFDMLSRYLESLSANRGYHLSSTSGSNRSREDSQNSSDGEFEASESRHMHKRKHKVNLRVLEQRLNKIQEECNKSADEEEGEVDEDAGEISDDPSTIPDDPESRQELAENAVNALTFVGTITEQPCETSDSNGAPKSIMEIYEQSRAEEYQWRAPPPFQCDDLDERASTRSCDVHVVATRRGGRNRNSSSGGGGRGVHPRGETNAKPKKPLARAHSCGSLLSLRERTLLKRNLPVIFDILKVTTAAVAADSGKDPSSKQQQQQLTLNLAAAAAVVGNPLAVFQLNHVSRCCSLC